MECYWWRNDITPEEYEDERYYFRYHYEEWKKTGHYKTLYDQDAYLDVPDDVLQEYAKICKKLGFDLRDLPPLPATFTEDARKENPFSILTTEEMDFLEDNGIMPLKHKNKTRA